jgi:hypothetical protein
VKSLNYLPCRQKLLLQEHCEAVYGMLVENSQNVRSAAAAFIEVAYLEGVLVPLFEEEAASKCTLPIDRSV